MTYSLIQRVQVKNFDTWLNPDLEGFAQMMRGQGVIAVSLHRGLEDRNSLAIRVQFADEATLHAFVAWYKVMMVEWLKQFPDSEQKALEWFLSEDVDSHTMTL